MRSNWRLVKQLLMRPNGNKSVNFFVLYFSFALNDGYKFHVFFSSNFGSFILRLKRNGVLYLALISGFGQLKCAAVEIYVIPRYERLVKT